MWRPSVGFFLPSPPSGLRTASPVPVAVSQGRALSPHKVECELGERTGPVDGAEWEGVPGNLLALLEALRGY